MAYRQKQDFQKARKSLERAIQANPRFYEAQVELGRVSIGESKVEEALDDYYSAQAEFHTVDFYSIGSLEYANTLRPEEELSDVQRYVQYCWDTETVVGDDEIVFQFVEFCKTTDWATRAIPQR